jgi:hypothetical protein
MINNPNHFWKRALADSEETISLCVFFLITTSMTIVGVIVLPSSIHILVAVLLSVTFSSVVAVIVTTHVSELIQKVITK